MGMKLGMHPVLRIQAVIPEGEFFSAAIPAQVLPLTAPGQWFDHRCYFGWHRVTDQSIPDWHENPFTGRHCQQSSRSWRAIPDFDAAIGDIKTIWEASRFAWVLAMTQHARHGEPNALARLNAWLADWMRRNPPYCGPNWKCGQEASIRIMHLAMAALMLEQYRQPERPLQALVAAHLKRIAPTIQYAIAQDNNHGTSEAAALFIGGGWLAILDDGEGGAWCDLGRKWLEERAARLIEPDGSFSQYSVTYHRVMLDTYCMAEQWRRCCGMPAFSPRLYRQLRAATHWLYQMTQAETGDAPNLGANDGARLLPLTDCDYRDFRPSVQMAMALFCERRAYGAEGDWNLPLHWLGVAVPETAATPVGSVQFAQGGYSVLRRGRYFALLRFPRFRFRPSQADALHVDLWAAGQNLLRDAGTYSYHGGDEAAQYFSGTAGHNTVQFDDRDQMPRLGKFLFGDWLTAATVTPVVETEAAVTTAAAYVDRQGASHQRKVQLSEQGLRVDDEVAGFRHKAILRWRLMPGDWQLEGDTLRWEGHILRITASAPIVRMALIVGWESRYYMKKESVPVLEVEIQQPGYLMTEYRFEPRLNHENTLLPSAFFHPPGVGGHSFL